MSTERKKQSPYQRYGKKPHLYSPEYYDWRRAVLSGNKADVRRLGQRHWQMVERTTGRMPNHDMAKQILALPSIDEMIGDYT